MTAEGRPGDGAVWARVGERVEAADYAHDEELGPLDRLRAEVAEQRAVAALSAGRAAEGRQLMERAVELFTAAGMPLEALRARARGACPPPADDETPQQAEQRRASQAELTELKARSAELLRSDPQAAAVHLTVVQCLLFTVVSGLRKAEGTPPADDLAAARELAEELRADAHRLGVPHREGLALEYQAEIGRLAGQADQTPGLLRRAIEVYTGAEQPWRSLRARAVLGQVLLSRGEFEPAAALFQEAIADAARFEDDDFPLAPAWAMLGHCLANTGDPAGAVRCLTEAADRSDLAGDPAQAAQARQELAALLRQTGRAAEAVAVLESVVADEHTAGLDERLLAQIRLDLARGLRDLDEGEAAAREFLTLASTVSAWPDQAVHALVAAEAAVALAVIGRWEQARTAYRAAVAAHEAGPNPGPVIEAARRLAALAAEAPEGQQAGGLDAALAHLAEADALIAATPDTADGVPRWLERGRTHYGRGRVLITAERYADAVGELDRAADCYAQGGPQAEGYRAETDRVAALVEWRRLGTVPAALARVNRAIGRCQAVGHDEAVRVLTELREEIAAGRS
jgi:tetratricopeptide (TPR) repeat protein